jgi:hypothetical protein
MIFEKPGERWLCKRLQMQGAQKLSIETHGWVHRNDEVAEQPSK